MKRILVLIDGLNLWHAINAQHRGLANIDLTALVTRLVNRNSETLVSTLYFSALANHLDGPEIRSQTQYFNQLQTSNIRVQLGRFQRGARACSYCGRSSLTHHEKETDVAIATALVAGAYENTYDKVLLFSADTDLIPAVRLVKTKFGDKEIKLVSTVAYLRPVHATLGRLCDGQIRLTQELLAPHLPLIEGRAASPHEAEISRPNPCA